MSWKVVECDPEDPRAVECVQHYTEEITARLGFYSVRTNDQDEYRRPGGAFFIALTDDGSAQGCAAIRTVVTTAGVRAGELKRMWVGPALRGQGVGRELLDAVVECAKELEHDTLLLDTHHNLDEARRLYSAAGFVDVETYNDNPHCTIWMGRAI